MQYIECVICLLFTIEYVVRQHQHTVDVWVQFQGSLCGIHRAHGGTGQVLSEYFDFPLPVILPVLYIHVPLPLRYAMGPVIQHIITVLVIIWDASIDSELG
jgi:hypothetical protein